VVLQRQIIKTGHSTLEKAEAGSLSVGRRHEPTEAPFDISLHKLVASSRRRALQ